MYEIGLLFKIVALILTLIQKFDITVYRIAKGRETFPSKFRLSRILKRCSVLKEILDLQKSVIKVVKEERKMSLHKFLCSLNFCLPIMLCRNMCPSVCQKEFLMHFFTTRDYDFLLLS